MSDITHDDGDAEQYAGDPVEDGWTEELPAYLVEEIEPEDAY